MVMDTTRSTGRWLSAERATKMFDRLTGLGATYVELRAMSCDSNTVRLRDGSMDAAVPAQDLGVTLRVLADGAWGVHSTTDLDSVYAQGEETLRVARAVAARRAAGEPMVELAEVPVITDEVVWAPKGDVRDLDLDARLDAMKAVDNAMGSNSPYLHLPPAKRAGLAVYCALHAAGLERGRRDLLAKALILCADTLPLLRERLLDSFEDGLDPLN